ncbi:MAG: hypothetical protein JJE04_05345 [Acidobacteriia bacterium]|nr:hypothetical protein [Terriglobia bacterium]
MILLDMSVVIDSFTGARHSARALWRVVEKGERVVPFGPEEASIAAELYRAVQRPRGREIDLAIAAAAIALDAELWTLNLGDFRDIPRLRVSAPA